jgi:shikimate dehydrogenase
MRKLGLIGFPLTHSFSKQYFENKFSMLGINDYTYELYPLETISTLPKLLAEQPQLIGLNVTIPYKQSVISYLDDTDISAQKAGAVNVISIKNNTLTGFNSDVYGFQESLLEWYSTTENHSLSGALILGNGGAASAVSFALDSLSTPHLFVTRRAIESPFIRYEEIDAKILDKYPLIINTTPLGTFPDIESMPAIPYHLLDERHSLYDLVYNPEITTFMANGLQRGCRVKNGLDMLHLQAEKAWEIWSQHSKA